MRDAQLHSGKDCLSPGRSDHKARGQRAMEELVAYYLTADVSMPNLRYLRCMGDFPADFKFAPYITHLSLAYFYL